MTSRLTPELVWAITAPEHQARWRATGMRLVVAYADRSADRVAELMPADPSDAQLLMMVFSEAFVEYARAGAALPDDELWSALTAMVDRTAPAGIRGELRALFTETAAAAVEPARIVEAIAAAESRPQISAHLGAAVLAVLSERAGNLDRLRHTAARLDPHPRQHDGTSPWS